MNRALVLVLATYSALLLLLSSGCVLLRAAFTDPLPPEAEVLLAQAADGVEIPVVHYKPLGTPRPAPPVLLLHGISANARHFDLDAEHSMARWLAARGFDAYSMSLRSTLDSLVPKEARKDVDSDATTLDTYATQDLPAVIELVKRRTGAAQVDFVGHSMGGLVLYAYLARGGDGIRAAVTLGSPARLRFGGKVEPFIREHGSILSHVSAVPNDTLAPLFWPVEGIETPLDLLLVNPQNTSLTEWHRMVVEGTASMAGGVLRQFQRGIADDRFESADGKLDYLDALKTVKTPILFVAGKTDRIALVDGVKAAYRVAGGDKRFLIAGVENGFAYDYNHLDMLAGERAPVELWPQVQTWFEAHASQ
jgi:pimeloyl-ACP methyl ester carboxylesterase